VLPAIVTAWICWISPPLRVPANHSSSPPGYAFPMIKDERHAIADRLGARATPEALLVDSEGKLRYRGWVKSRQESPDLQHALDAALEGRPVRRPETKAFGCAIDHN